MDSGVKMLQEVKGDWWKSILKADPVRPHIDIDFRITDNRQSFVLSENGIDADAVICVAFTNDVATTEEHLHELAGDEVAMLYTVWSHTHGAGRTIVNEMQEHLLENYPTVKRIVTLSPPTKMARRFHTNNGAFELQVNDDTVNYEYPILIFNH